MTSEILKKRVEELKAQIKEVRSQVKLETQLRRLRLQLAKERFIQIVKRTRVYGLMSLLLSSSSLNQCENENKTE